MTDDAATGRNPADHLATALAEAARHDSVRTANPFLEGAAVLTRRRDHHDAQQDLEGEGDPLPRMSFGSHRTGRAMLPNAKVHRRGAAALDEP